MRYFEKLMIGWVALAAAIAVGQASKAPQQDRTKTDPQKTHTAQDRGQQVFNQNCSRCHNAPEGFSPSISGTIPRHMRVRAGLSEEDYKALLKFLNP